MENRSNMKVALESAFGKPYEDPYRILRQAVRDYLTEDTEKNWDRLGRLVYPQWNQLTEE